MASPSGINAVASMLRVIGGFGVVVAAGSWINAECLYNVDGGERVVIFDRFRGIVQGVKGEGTHFKVPYIQYPTYFDIRSKPRIINTTTGTKDLQMVNIALRILSRPDEVMLPQILDKIGIDYDERVLPSIGNEVLKAVVAQFNADQLLTMRESVSKQINDELSARAKNFNVLLDDVSITHLTFGQEFTNAIEFKQVAQQEAERSKFVVMRSEQEKRVRVIEAEGEAEAAQLISDALGKHGSGLIEVRRIDAAREIADTLGGSRNVAYLPGSGMLLNLGLGGATQQ
jgi:prohibitin 1